MKTTNFFHDPELVESYGYRDEEWDTDLTPVSYNSKSTSLLALAAFGCAFSVSSANVHYSNPFPANSIECAVDMDKTAQYEMLSPFDEENNAWDFCKTLRFSKNRLVQDDNIIVEDRLPSVSNLLKLSEFSVAHAQLKVLPAFAEDLLQKVWLSELSDEPLIPGLK